MIRSLKIGALAALGNLILILVLSLLIGGPKWTLHKASSFALKSYRATADAAITIRWEYLPAFRITTERRRTLWDEVIRTAFSDERWIRNFDGERRLIVPLEDPFYTPSLADFPITLVDEIEIDSLAETFGKCEYFGIREQQRHLGSIDVLLYHTVRFFPRRPHLQFGGPLLRCTPDDRKWRCRTIGLVVA